ncbi:transmembrane protein, putative (macronuclear) [Tetrahymena thermophila SB210]|uniref:Transmembrane protein, putative n=1 Tax=Tetrahymena thermophila (strain SB210) TaxID=312017 RepID=Q232K0_TETTS|nr:transmembrane protein, putative [Tetrahymena thermophila SB210]EAR91412.1 transmembrane protein, putative [Tetrahymena thermophila SB210]|eukprot:XP_001011657.1 transmembrane protein, putative [Tetrahymena thermophila SB210]
MRSTVFLVAILSPQSFATIYSIKSQDREETEFLLVQQNCLKIIDPDIGVNVGILILNQCQQNMTFIFTLNYLLQPVTSNCLGYLETQIISQIPSTGAVGFELRQITC